MTMPNSSGITPVFTQLSVNAAGQSTAGVNEAGQAFFTGVQANGPIVIPETGTAPRMGVATLNGTTAVTVTTAGLTANSRVFLTIQTPAGTPGAPYVASITPGTGFTVKSSTGDTSVVAWHLIDHT
jgi:hypothetical protein